MPTTSKLVGALGFVLATAGTAAVASAQTRDTPPRLPVSPPAPIARDVPPPKTGTAVVSGRVVDAITGRGLSRARIRLFGPVTQGPILTGDDGTFQFDALPQGGYNLMAEKSSYSTARYPEQGRSVRSASRPLDVRAGERVEDLTIRMFRGGAIAGRVVDAQGDPVENASITVMLVPRGGRPQPRGGGQTNDLGEFRVWRLEPGRYLVRARGNAFGNDGTKPLPQPVPVYYPNALTMDQAQAVVVNRGESVTGVDITLSETIPTVVSGLVLPADGQPLVGGSINYRQAADIHGSDGGTGIRADGTFRLQMPPGDYIFEARSQPNRGPAATGQVYRPESELFGTVRVTVSGEALEGLIIPIGTGATASGRIVFEGKTPPPTVVPQQTRPPLFNPDGPGCRPGAVTIAPDWSFKAVGLGGTCAAQPQGMFGRWTLKAVMVGDDNLMDKSITFQPGDAYTNVRIVVTDLRPSVEFRVNDETGELSREFVVLVFPADKAKWNQLGRFVRTFSVSLPPEETTTAAPPGVVTAANTGPQRPRPGLVRMSPMPFGEYYAVAVDDIEQEDLQDIGLLEKLAPSGVRFTVSGEAPLEVPLRRVQLSSVVR
jgi:hypothetical protein